MTTDAEYGALVERPWRCNVTGNPVGTDTRMVGAPPCDCQGCRAASAIEALIRDRDEANERLTAAVDDFNDAKARIAELEAGLAFYADPDTYVAIGFFPDPPCGEFMEDCEEFEEAPGYIVARPGKRARALLSTEASDDHQG